ncbi:MAG: hypothetical protein ACXACD_06380 [Candidatus Thorarchaeota archaeon]
MTFADILLLLRQDLNQTFRISGAKGKRTEQKSAIRRFLRPLVFVIIAVVIIWGIVTIVPLFGWSIIADVVISDPGFGATIFNLILIVGGLGSIAFSATTVGNVNRMEYLLTMPIPMRTIFLEKTIIIILYNSMIWMVIGVPIYIGLSILSPASLAALSIPVFIVLLFSLVTLGVSLGGLLGLLFSRLFAGRRTLKQIGWFLGTTLTILISTLYYVFIWVGDGGEGIFEGFFDILRSLGLASDISPGYAVSSLSLNILVGAPLQLQDMLLGVLYIVVAFELVYANSLVSERAHYSGWLASGSKRSTKEHVPLAHTSWNPQPIPGFRFNQTVSVSIWYNLSSIRREGRVLAQYLVGPMRMAIWFVLPFIGFGEGLFAFTPLFLLAALIPFMVSYGVYFAGYETVYEGSNLMTLQLAAANFSDYVKGKAISAVPFVIAATTVGSVILFIISPALWSILPAIVIASIFICLAAGSIAANAAAMGGDFKSQRMIERQRGAAVQMPIRGWSMLRAQLVPYVLGYAGVYSIIGVAAIVGGIYGDLFGALSAYAVLGVFSLVCYLIFNRYSHSAGVKLAQVEASKYL